MDPQLQTFARVLACGGFFGLLGAAFGGLVGHLAWKRGRPAGSFAGLALARALARVSRQEHSAGTTGLLVGGTDGLLFLGLIGTALGLLAARGYVGWTALSQAAFALLVLAGTAVLFGAIASGILYAGARAIAGVFAGGMLGAASGAMLARADGVVLGALGGIIAGTVIGVTSRALR
jgi:hypothetical protein